MQVFIPIMKYVGGEDYMIIEREVLAKDATAEEIRRYLADLYPDEAELLYIRDIYGNNVGKYLRERERIERYSRKQERYLMLLLRRKAKGE